MYEMVNGHSNWYWRWGLEDHDMAHRISSVYEEKSGDDAGGENFEVKGFSKNGSFTGLLRQVKADLNLL